VKEIGEERDKEERQERRGEKGKTREQGGI
jgi:hypothetical protein